MGQAFHVQKIYLKGNTVTGISCSQEFYEWFTGKPINWQHPSKYELFIVPVPSPQMGNSLGECFPWPTFLAALLALDQFLYHRKLRGEGKHTLSCNGVHAFFILPQLYEQEQEGPSGCKSPFRSLRLWKPVSLISILAKLHFLQLELLKSWTGCRITGLSGDVTVRISAFVLLVPVRIQKSCSFSLSDPSSFVPTPTPLCLDNFAYLFAFTFAWVFVKCAFLTHLKK